MKFDKNKNEKENLNIFKKEILKNKNPYAKILADLIFDSSDSDVLRNTIKERIGQHIENKLKK